MATCFRRKLMSFHRQYYLFIAEYLCWSMINFREGVGYLPLVQ